jgi:hypothetical protein
VKLFKNDKNLSITNQTNNPTKGDKKVKMEGHKSWQIKNTPKRANHKGNKKNSST